MPRRSAALPINPEKADYIQPIQDGAQALPATSEWEATLSRTQPKEISLAGWGRSPTRLNTLTSKEPAWEEVTAAMNANSSPSIMKPLFRSHRVRDGYSTQVEFICLIRLSATITAFRTISSAPTHPAAMSSSTAERKKSDGVTEQTWEAPPLHVKGSLTERVSV